MITIFRLTKCYRTFRTSFQMSTSSTTLAGTASSASSTESNPTVTYETQGNLAIISLCRPDARNAIDANMNARLRWAFGQFESDNTVNVGVLVGTGGSFSTGIDMRCTESIRNLGNRSSELQRKHFQKPMVCGIGGFCLAGGLELALMCDLRVVEEDATLGFFNRRFGVPMAAGVAQRLSALIGQSRALDLILTGRPIAGKEALDMGLANRMVATGTALGQAVTLAKNIAKYPQTSLLNDRNATLGETEPDGLVDAEAIRSEIEFGVEQFRTSRDRDGKLKNVKRNEMAEWEISEYNIELKNSRK